MNNKSSPYFQKPLFSTFSNVLPCALPSYCEFVQCRFTQGRLHRLSSLSSLPFRLTRELHGKWRNGNGRK